VGAVGAGLRRKLENRALKRGGRREDYARRGRHIKKEKRKIWPERRRKAQLKRDYLTVRGICPDRRKRVH